MGLIIAGVDVDEWSKQRKLIQQEANKIVARNLETVENLLYPLGAPDGVTQEQVEEVATAITPILEETQAVVDASGIEYGMEYLNGKIEDAMYNGAYTPMAQWPEVVRNAYRLLDSLYYDQGNWESSNC